ncbi:invasin domain 3-containing protein, partial [Morganella sp. EGD-HP17]|uniref:invasin domain 3-containing protein n=1 Tax=Morganella sp. EGD-HP17 TaxID=1435146 RepID=UPI0004469F76
PLPDTVISAASGNGDGSYSAVLSGTRAGEAAVLVTVNGQALPVRAAAVTLTATSPVQSTSAISTDKAAYPAGSDIAVTVTLKDANSNPVTGQSSLLTDAAVRVAGAVSEPGRGWTDNGNGTYTRLYVAETAGTGLTAALRLTGWGADSVSSPYSVTSGSPVQLNSAIAVDNVTYASGDDIRVTVTLKDAQGNMVTGQSSSLTGSSVTVPGSSVKTGTGWTDNADGTYSGTYVAEKAGTQLKATLQLTGWSGADSSAAYDITAGEAVPFSSAVSTDKNSYIAGSEIIVTVSLKDKQGNNVAGESAALTATTVTVPNATQKAGSSWTDHGDGTYTAAYTADTAGTGLKATLQLGTWG